MTDYPSAHVVNEHSGFEHLCILHQCPKWLLTSESACECVLLDPLQLGQEWYWQKTESHVEITDHGTIYGTCGLLF